MQYDEKMNELEASDAMVHWMFDGIAKMNDDYFYGRITDTQRELYIFEQFDVKVAYLKQAIHKLLKDKNAIQYWESFNRLCASFTDFEKMNWDVFERHQPGILSKIRKFVDIKMIGWKEDPRFYYSYNLLKVKLRQTY